MSARQKWSFGGLLLITLFSGCASKPYYHEHNLAQLNVVFTDIETINKLYRERLHQAQKPMDHYVYGFFDPYTNTIYVEEMNFETLGHEVTHAIFAPYNFHAKR